MISLKRFFAGVFLSLSLLLVVAPAHAQLQGNPLERFGEKTFGTVFKTDTNVEQTLPRAVGRVIQLALSFIGVIMLVLFVYAGFLWLTAGGNDDQVGQAKQYIKNAVIGTLIALSAYALTSFVVSQLERVTQGSSGSRSGAPAATTPTNPPVGLPTGGN